MTVVVSDTSPIRALHHLELLDILRKLFGEVVIPPAVARELAEPRSRFVRIDATSIPGFAIRPPSDLRRVEALRMSLDEGESEAIELAVEVRAELLIIDELKARGVARSLGLSTTGVVGVLIRAKKRGLIDSIAPLLGRLHSEIGFHLSEEFRREALRLAGESV